MSWSWSGTACGPIWSRKRTPPPSSPWRAPASSSNTTTPPTRARPTSTARSSRPASRPATTASLPTRNSGPRSTRTSRSTLPTFPRSMAATRRSSRSILAVPTIPEILQAAGHWTAVAGSKPVAQFFDRARTRTSEAAKKSTVIYRGKVLPAEAGRTNHARARPIPAAEELSRTRSEDDWTTNALTNVLWQRRDSEIFPPLAERTGPDQARNRARRARRDGRDQEQRSEPGQSAGRA